MTNETKSKLDSVAKKGSLSVNTSIYSIDIPCWTYFKKSGETEIGKCYFVDLTDPDIRKKLENGVFPIFEEAMGFLFYEEYYNTPEEISNNNDLVFITDDKTPKYNLKMEKNFSYIRKRFINEKDLPTLLSLFNSKNMTDYSAEFVFNDELYNLRPFNCIYGPNGSGKTMMMKAISDQFNVPLYSANIYSDLMRKNLKYMLDNLDRSTIEMYFKKLWGLSTSKKISPEMLNFLGYGELSMLYIASILANQELEKNRILLIDDIYWNNLDSIRTLNVIETLGSISTPVVITASVEQPRNIVRKRVYGSNIIEL